MVNNAENKMGVMPIGKLLMNISLPMMISMLVQALYNVVDSIFVANLCEDALTAVSLAFPMQVLLIAVSTGTGVGVGALLSRYLGAKDQRRVNSVATHGVILYVISYAVFLILGFTISLPYFNVMAAGNETILEMGVSYLTIIFTCSFGLFNQIYTEKLLQSTGKTFYSMVTQTTGAVINIILDPIMIFGLCGFPEMGVAGAAAATVVGQTVAGIIAFVLCVKKNTEVRVDFKGFRMDGNMVGKIYQISVPTIVMQAIGTVLTSGMNIILMAFSSTATAVFGVYFKIQSIFFMPALGLNNGIVPIVAYNYGAGNRKRISKTIKLGLIVCAALTAVGGSAFILVPEFLLGFFNASPEMIEIGVTAFRIIGCHFFIAWISITGSGLFQGLGEALYSMIISICRQLAVLLPAAYILSKIGGLNAVWWSFPLAELTAAILTVIFMGRCNKKTLCHLPDGND